MQYLVIQQAVNYLIKSGNADISPLNGKTVRFSLQDLPLNVDFVFTNNRVFVLSNKGKNVDVSIDLKSVAFIAIIQGEDLNELLKQDKIMVNGDVKTAQLVVGLLNNAEIDFEEELSSFTGDIIAHKIGSIVSKVKDRSKDIESPMEIVKDGLIKLLISPSKSKLYKNKHT
ncbi:MAG: SCP2 sterol-binding domain-containing protein [Gammaproteobacteria bacterium]|nr:SCP2 sterol-binding domain-containing protein [Gammaproteobacteria bacterium]